LEELRLEERKATQFKAQPAKILTKEPFKVKLDHTRSAGTDVVEFNLSTTRRAQERKQYDEYLKQREEEMEENKLLVNSILFFITLSLSTIAPRLKLYFYISA